LIEELESENYLRDEKYFVNMIFKEELWDEVEGLQDDVEEELRGDIEEDFFDEDLIT
jgi:hypothetical protein